MRSVFARAATWAAMSGCSQGGGTRGRANRSCTSARKAIRIYERCWCRVRTTFWDRLFADHRRREGTFLRYFTACFICRRFASHGESSGPSLSYDLVTAQLRQRYVFSDPVSVMRFSQEGKHFLVLTADQDVYIFDPSATN